MSSDKLRNCDLQQNTLYIITEPIDLNGKTIAIPENCSIIFKRKGSIKNGVLLGINTSIEYHCPFIGDNVSLKNCHIVNRKIIKDKDVYLKVGHTQKEIQTLFDLSDGIRIEFSKGVYNNVERIGINNCIDVDFNNSTICLKHDDNYVAECFYMEPWINKHIEYCNIYNLNIQGARSLKNPTSLRRCIQLFYVSNVILKNISIEKFSHGLGEHDNDVAEFLNRTNVGSSAVSIICYDKCTIDNCKTTDIDSEIFWCVPNVNPNNLTVFTNNISINTTGWGSHSFLTLLDGRCIVKHNEVHNYNGSAFNALCYDSDISKNKFFEGKRSWAIDLSEGVMYKAKNVHIHDNECVNSKGLVSAFGDEIVIENNRWINTVPNKGERFPVIDINTRGKRTKDGSYIECSNNPEYISGTKHIIIRNNSFANNCNENGTDIISGYFYGDSITYLNNRMNGFNVPVVQLVIGEDFKYLDNKIISSKEGKYPELFIKRGKNVYIEGNSFSHNYSAQKFNCTVQFGVAEGEIEYKGNVIKKYSSDSREIVYVPCFIEDKANLKRAEIFVYKLPKGINVESGINTEQVLLKTNINKR